MLRIRETQYKNFGNCVCLENDTIRLVASADFGPRILFYGFIDGGNVLFEDADRIFTQDNGEYGTWTAFGGHRLWKAPETLPETYYPDNEGAGYSFENGVLTLFAPPTPWGKRFSIEITMDGEGSAVHIRNLITNVSDKPDTFAPWAITSMTTGGTAVIPLNRADKGFLPNRAMALWSYSDIRDPRFELRNDAAFLTQDIGCDKAFKAGFSVDRRYAAYRLSEQLFVMSFGGYDEVAYPDFSCNFEAYTNKHFLECELVGELRSYLPSEAAEISEDWRLFPLKANEARDADGLAELAERLALD